MQMFTKHTHKLDGCIHQPEINKTISAK